jgi:hypothetical protein
MEGMPGGKKERCRRNTLKVEEILDFPSRRAFTTLFAFRIDISNFSLDKKILRGIFHNTLSYCTFCPI